jgi:hypothetical protein
MRHSTSQTSQDTSRDTSQGTGQASSVSGGSLLTKGALTFLAVLFLVMTAGAIAASSRTRAVTPELWKQPTPAYVLSLPGGYGVVEALY